MLYFPSFSVAAFRHHPIMGNGSSDAGGDSSDHIHNVCVHNDRDGVSVADITEHVGNFEFGSAIRDTADVIDGHQEWSGWNQPLPDNDSSSADSSSSANDTSSSEK